MLHEVPFMICAPFPISWPVSSSPPVPALWPELSSLDGQVGGFCELQAFTCPVSALAISSQVRKVGHAAATMVEAIELSRQVSSMKRRALSFARDGVSALEYMEMSSTVC